VSISISTVSPPIATATLPLSWQRAAVPRATALWSLGIQEEEEEEEDGGMMEGWRTTSTRETSSFVFLLLLLET